MKKLHYLILIFATSYMVSCSSEPAELVIDITSISSRGDEGGGANFSNGNGTSENKLEVSEGSLTAGEWSDLAHWDFWELLMQKEMYYNYQKQWNFYPTQRYSLVLEDPSGNPVHDAKVSLLDAEDKIIWRSKTNNKGKAELWGNLFQDKQMTQATILVEYAQQKYTIKKATTFNQGINNLVLSAEAAIPENKADVMVVIDATGSMQDEISYMKAELEDVVSQVKTQMPEMQLQLGAIFYRDNGDKYITRESSLSANTSEAITFMENQSAAGGGDYPEAVDIALEKAIADQNWSLSAKTRIVFLMLDAPPHQDDKTFQRLQATITKASAKGIQIIPIASSGMDKDTEFLMRFFAITTNSSYLFLTDHSGIGNEHLEPTIGKFKVEYLNDLLTRIILQTSETVTHTAL